MNNEESESPIKAGKGWHYTGPLPVQQAPYFELPLSVVHCARNLFDAWRPLNLRFLLLLLVFAIWTWFSPELYRSKTFELGWILEIAIRNFFILLFVAGGLHLYLYTFRVQGDEGQYDARIPNQRAKKYSFGRQHWDNAFWTLAGGTTVGTLWESGMRWAYANGHATMLSFEAQPIWFVCLFFIIPIWSGIHFYFTHRALHIKPLYKWIHSWHHRNIVTGPWSGHSMHPIEHIILYSDMAIYLLVASHPVHMLFNMMLHTVAGPTSHAGFERVKFGRYFSVYIGDFMHQLHHRYVDCNYGAYESPWDKVFGSFHDGTAEGDAFIKKRRQESKFI